MAAQRTSDTQDTPKSQFAPRRSALRHRGSPRCQISAAPSAPVPAAPLPILAAAMQVEADGHDTAGSDWLQPTGRSGAVACRLHLVPFQRSASGRNSSLIDRGGVSPTAVQSVVDGHETLMNSEGTPSLLR